MQEFKHILISRAVFKDKELFRKYLDISKQILVPGIKNQTNKNFEWCLMIIKEDVGWVRDYLECDFTPIGGINSLLPYVKERGIHIQTRHDIDDYMSNDYVDAIQKLYVEHIDTYDPLVIHAQPLVRDIRTKKTAHLPPYGPKKNSMFLSLCQKNVEHHVFERKHAQMYEVAKHTMMLPEGFTEWIRHGNQIITLRSVKREDRL